MTFPTPTPAAPTPAPTSPEASEATLPLDLNSPEFAQLAEEYAILKSKSQAIETRIKEIGPLLRASLAGQKYQVGEMVLEAQPSNVTTYDIDKFLDAFGVRTTLNCATISNTRVAELVKSGDLDKARLASIAVVEPRTPALKMSTVKPSIKAAAAALMQEEGQG